MPNTHLMEMLDFTSDDLATNRNGRLSNRQKAKLQRKMLAIIAGYGLLTAVCVAFLLLSLRDASSTPYNGGLYITVLGTGIASLILIAITMYKGNQVQRDMNNGKVAIVEGKISLRVMETRTLRYRLQLGELELEIPKRAYQELTDSKRYSKRYRIYYAAKSRTILSIEQLW